MRLNHRDPTVGVQAALAVLAYLDAASGAATYTDEPCAPGDDGLVNAETGEPIAWRTIERCREDVARALGVEVEVYIQRRDESDEEFDRRSEGWS